MSKVKHMKTTISFLAVACLGAIAPAQNWVLRQVPGPSPRAGHSMAFDSARGVTVLFGGLTASGQVLQDTWEWNGAAWLLRSPATSPGSSGRMVYDSARGVCVLLRSNETWEWDGTAWALRATQNVQWPHVAYDPVRARTVVLHQLATPTAPAIVMEWDGSTWQSIATATGPFYSVMSVAYDPSTQRVCAYTPFQGFSSPTAGARLWQWDGASWTSNAPITMGYNSGGVMVTMPPSLAIYGGTDAFTPIVGLYGPFSNVGQVTPASPGGRGGHAMAWDAARQRLVLFGGTFMTASGILQTRGDTWEYVQGSITADSAPYGQGCGAPAPTLAAAPGSRPLLGTTFVADVGNTTLGATGMSWGTSGQMGPSGFFSQLPLDLAPWGMPGCPLHTSADGLANCTTAGGATQFLLAVPTSMSLIAVQVYLQAFTFRAAANPLQMVVSNGLQVTIGNL